MAEICSNKALHVQACKKAQTHKHTHTQCNISENNRNVAIHLHVFLVQKGARGVLDHLLKILSYTHKTIRQPASYFRL